MTLPISVQLYSVRDALKVDPWDTLAKIADMGYVGVEPFGVIGDDVGEMARRISDLGLVVSTCQTGTPVDDNANRLMDEAETLGCKHIVCPFHAGKEWLDIEGIARTAELFNRAVASTAARGMTFGFHNHDIELTVVDGKPGLLQLAAKVPGMFFTVDTYWVEVGGQSAVEIVKALGSQANVLHIKDGPIKNAKECAMVAAGSGAMDFPPIVAVAEGAQWLVVEIDRCDTDMMTATAESIDYLAEAGLGHKRA